MKDIVDYAEKSRIRKRKRQFKRLSCDSACCHGGYPLYKVYCAA